MGELHSGTLLITLELKVFWYHSDSSVGGGVAGSVGFHASLRDVCDSLTSYIISIVVLYLPLIVFQQGLLQFGRSS